MLRYRDTKVKEFWQEITVGGESSILYLNVLTDGDAVPYGLLGVEIRQSLMTRFLTYGDLTASKKSGYAISHWDGSDLYRPIFLNGPYVKSKLGEKPHHFTPIRNSKFVTYSGDLYDDRAYHVDDFVAIALPLRLYEKGSKMQQENQWVMIAYIAKDEFYIYTDRVRNILIIQTISAIVFSIAIASLLSGMLVRPLRTIIQDIQSSELDGELALRNVDVTELDLLIDTIRKLT
ncbi:MAG: hypothetical protein Q4A52_04165, partial [Bacillota bacterium]|nr:hypothetical protein [Bacillota bacterium]